MIKKDYFQARTTILFKEDDEYCIKIMKMKPTNKNIKLIKNIVTNDRYSKYIGKCNDAECEVTSIKPASEEDIKKYMYKKIIKVKETYNEYMTNVKPIMHKNVKWIDNILDKSVSSENILYENQYCVFCPDLKWDRKNMDNFYGLIIMKNNDICCLRDLDGEHVNMLEYIREDILGFIKKTYDIDEEDIRMYFHYPPSFWHLHIHVNLVKNKHEGLSPDFCWNLWDVIQNLKLDEDYFKKIEMNITKKIV